MGFTTLRGWEIFTQTFIASWQYFCFSRRPRDQVEPTVSNIKDLNFSLFLMDIYRPKNLFAPSPRQKPFQIISDWLLAHKSVITLEKAKQSLKLYQTDFLKLTKVSSHWQNPNILQNDIRLTLSSQKCDQIEILCEALSWSGHNVLLEVHVELWWFSFTDLISFSISGFVGSSCRTMVVFIYWFDF